MFAEYILRVYIADMQIARLFPNGQSQAVRLPKEFRFEGDKVYIQRVGSTVVLLPYNAPWEALFESLAEFSPDFAGESGAGSVDVAAGGD
jgi:antitoxin VapB